MLETKCDLVFRFLLHLNKFICKNPHLIYLIGIFTKPIENFRTQLSDTDQVVLLTNHYTVIITLNQFGIDRTNIFLNTCS